MVNNEVRVEDIGAVARRGCTREGEIRCVAELLSTLRNEYEKSRTVKLRDAPIFFEGTQGSVVIVITPIRLVNVVFFLFHFFIVAWIGLLDAAKHFDEVD